MIRAIDNKPLELTDDEFEYYNAIVEAFGANVFQGTFEVDDDVNSLFHGFITLVKPPMKHNLPMGAMFFLMNCMLNQRIRVFEQKILKMDNK